ncbi:MAG: hypothetical protein AVDCRST_MAG11-3199 [uncultured Gemmatimonadaceae bacterium]|uniref:Uncharacterized protein n=1 Tax=uncultured Gemmatimonadaceae bacterium TaxID=246130 RepID=A0A6J4LYE8_9BACT|nr:MAG: hypothetical protein AVDCRST_MAG11-3199 [uncultured Gemmatimonadaceae bacterium]
MTTATGFAGPLQDRGAEVQQIREQVRRDVERALRDAQRAGEDGARAGAEGARAGEEAARAVEEALRREGVVGVPGLPPAPPGRVFVSGTRQPFRVSPEIPPQAVDIAFGFFWTVAAIFIGTPLARAYARRMDRRPVAAAAASPDVLGRLDRIEHAVDAVALEVERISEGQRFVTKMMAEQPRGLPGPNEAAAAEVRAMERGVAERAAAERGS